MAAVVLRRRLTDRQEDQSALGVDGAKAPVRGRSGRHPVVLRPGFGPGLAWVRNRVEGPDQLAVSKIPRADVHRGTFGVVFLSLRTGDDHVAVDQSWRRHHVRHLRELVGDAGAQVDRSSVAERGHRLSRRGVECEQTSVGRSRENSREQPALTGPVRHTAVGRAAFVELVFPDLFPGRRLQRDDRPPRRGCVENAAHEDRDGLAPAHCGHRRAPAAGRLRDAVLPRELQPGNVLRVDLSERGIPRPLRIARVRWPPRRSGCLSVEAGRRRACHENYDQASHQASAEESGKLKVERK